MKWLVLILLLWTGVLGKHADTANILAIFSMPSPSHYIFIQPLLRKLAEKGHQVTVVGVYPQKQPVHNFHDIVIEKNVHILDDFMTEAAKGSMFNSLGDLINMYYIYQNMTVNILEHPEFQQLLAAPAGKFDLIIQEVLWPFALSGLGEHFKAPMIAVSPLGAATMMDDVVGNMSPNSVVPNTMLPYSSRMTFLQRLLSLWVTINEFLVTELVNNKLQKEVYHEYFPNAQLTYEEAKKSYSLLLVNQHHSLSYPRPYVTNVIEVGGLHIPENPEPLPKELLEFLDNARAGVIYFSMGSNIKSAHFSMEKRNIILSVFRNLNQSVLWKFEDDLPNKPKNVLTCTWCPQHSILKHENIKVFITHGGLLSTTEAIFYGKPILGIPMMAEQPRNVLFAVNRGIALQLDFHKLNEHDLKHALYELLYNKKYIMRMQDISQQYHDKPMTAMETAVYWVEYVLRHKGAKHLENASIYLNIVQYYSVDVFVAIVFIVLFIIILIIWLIKMLFILLMKLLSTPKKIKKT